MMNILLIVLPALILAESDVVIDLNKIKFAVLTEKNITNSPDEKITFSYDRIINGDDVARLPPNEQLLFAHQVRLLSANRQDGSVLECGGSIISDRCIITAAHCLRGSKYDSFLDGMIEYNTAFTMVYFGIQNLRMLNDANTIRRRVEAADRIIHDGWNPQNRVLHDDIALLRLVEPVNFVPNRIAAIALPTQQECEETDFIGEEAIISGWGLMEDQVRTNELQFARTLIRPDNRCQTYLSFRANQNICALGRNFQNTCQGDSGGPMVIRDVDLIQQLIGITSFGHDNCDFGFPAVYTKICGYLQDWIMPNLNAITQAPINNGRVQY